MEKKSKYGQILELVFEKTSEGNKTIMSARTARIMMWSLCITFLQFWEKKNAFHNYFTASIIAEKSILNSIFHCDNLPYVVLQHAWLLLNMFYGQ